MHLLYNHRWIPETDILSKPLDVGDKVVIFNEHFISWENCTVIERVYNDEENIVKRAIQVDDNMWFFGLGTHEILKCE